MQEAIHRHSEDLRRTHGLEVQARVGINSGEVVVGAPGTIRVRAETLRLAEGYVAVRPLGRHAGRSWERAVRYARRRRRNRRRVRAGRRPLFTREAA